MAVVVRTRRVPKGPVSIKSEQQLVGVMRVQPKKAAVDPAPHDANDTLTAPERDLVVQLLNQPVPPPMMRRAIIRKLDAAALEEAQDKPAKAP